MLFASGNSIHDSMKLIIGLISALVLVILLIVINPVDINLKGDNKNRTLKEWNQYQNNIDTFFECILYQDSASIVCLFSKNAISEVGIENFNNMLTQLYEYCKFDQVIEINKKPGSMEEGSLRGEKKSRTICESYNITTNNGIYKLCVKYVETDQFDKGNEGIWSISIMKCDAHTQFESNYWGNSTFASGIWVNDH